MIKFSFDIRSLEMMESGVVFLCLLCLVSCVLAIFDEGPELLANSDMEEELDGDKNWFCAYCVLTRDTDSYAGLYSVKVTSR